MVNLSVRMVIEHEYDQPYSLTVSAKKTSVINVFHFKYLSVSEHWYVI